MNGVDAGADPFYAMRFVIVSAVAVRLMREVATAAELPFVNKQFYELRWMRLRLHLGQPLRQYQRVFLEDAAVRHEVVLL